MKEYSCTLVMYLVAVLAFGQNMQADSAQKLQPVFIKSLRLNNLNNASVIQTISAPELLSRQGSSMAEVLQENTPVFIRNYGSGGLATASFRGSNAYHTPVIWNGINIQNPMNGQIDFSSIPVFLSDEISLQYGGNGGVWGSGAMAGLLFINSAIATHQKPKVELLASAFDYGVFQNAIKISFNHKRLFSSTKVYNNFGNNNFEYEYKNNTYFQKNASLNTNGFQQVLSFQKNAKTSFTGLVWYGENDKQIAPNLSALPNNASQKDKNLRTAITWNNKTLKGNNELKLSYFYDELFYESNDIPKSMSKSYTFNLSAEKNIHFNEKNSIHFGIIDWLAFAKVDGYEKAVYQNRFSGFVYYKYQNKKYQFLQQFGLRKELVNERFIPIMPSYFLQKTLFKNILFKANVARTYRLPTFNDLYWKNGGNLNLQSEQGWSSDAALNFNQIKEQFSFDFTFSMFYRYTENYIQWIPINSAVFSPINIGNVTAKGIEIIAKSSYQFSKNTNFQINYLGSFLTAVDSKNDLQLIFTPRIKHIISLYYNYKNFTLKYSHIYTGVSFTKSDLSEWNNDFEIGNLVVSKSFVFNSQNNLSMQFGVNNVWNKSYLIMPDRPMPLRNFQFTLQYSITKK
ncbi:MAG: TonB-dependent receptor plug domain-containing protein [Bacteroidia bacterium]